MTGTGAAVPFKMLLQARFASEGLPLCDAIDEAISKLAERTADGSHGDAIAHLRRIALDGSVGHALPFRLDPLDRSIATLLLKGMPADDSEGIVFGDASMVNAGFTTIRSNSLQYCDSWVEPSRTRPWVPRAPNVTIKPKRARGKKTSTSAPSPVKVRLVPSNRGAFQAEVRDLASYQPTVIAGDGEEAAIILRGVGRAITARRFDGYLSSLHVLAPSAQTASRSALAGVRIEHGLDQDEVHIALTRPEAILQMSAAHQQGRWVEVECGEFRAIFPAPDLAGDGKTAPAWVPCRVSDETYVFTDDSPEVEIPLELALKCCESFRWFAISDTWEMARRLSASTSATLSPKI